jgi:glycosyltransferase involved in cell wall biosynthesis
MKTIKIPSLFAVSVFLAVANDVIGKFPWFSSSQSLFATARLVDDDNSSVRKKKKLGLFTASLPWTFGPYQEQMHQLSMLLSFEYGNHHQQQHKRDNDDDIEYEIYWLTFAVNLPSGIYKNYAEIQKHVPNIVPPPDDFPLDHIQFLGVPREPSGKLYTSKINEIAKKYGLDLLVSLMDVTKVVPDEEFMLPFLAWVPLHSDTVKRNNVDYWVLRKYHGIAGVAPSGAMAIHDAVGREITLSSIMDSDNLSYKRLREIIGTTQVEFIPHIIDRKAILSSGAAGLSLLGQMSVAEADAKLTRSDVIHRGQESTLEAGHHRSLFSEHRKNDFIVLLQGGNYESEDRKGWDTSLQAFVRFYNSLEDPSHVHLLIHSMESYLIAADHNSDQDAPAAVLPKGNMLHLILYELGLPRDAYTVDIARHAPEVVAAYKTRADVCLHPSKVEGFGMNVIECQAVGTPVITTNYTAMGDFTKLGRSVPPRQTIRSPGELYRMALPDVIGIADALGEIYQEYLSIKQGDEMALSHREKEMKETNDWIDETFSPIKVGNAFKSLLRRTSDEFIKRSTAKQFYISSFSPPTYGGYRIASGYHSTIVDWDEPWTILAPEGLKIFRPQQLHSICWSAILNDAGGSNNNILVMPAVYEDGTPVPFMSPHGDGVPHDDLPILVKTYMLAALQTQASRKKSLVLLALQNSAVPRILNEGFAQIDRRGNDSGNSFGRSSHFGEL